MRPHLMVIWGFASLFAFDVAATAEETLSKSNEPAYTIDLRLSSLLVQERQALRKVTAERVRQLTTAPVRARKNGTGSEIDYTNDWLAAQPVASGDAAFECLAEALYFEARGESVKGQFAVGEVILNRVDSKRFPKTVCAVVNQGTGKRYRCQFTYTCDGYKEVIREPAAYINVAKVARALLDGAPRILTNGATYYHTHRVHPRWSRKFTRTASLGAHYFYRAPTLVSKR